MGHSVFTSNVTVGEDKFAVAVLEGVGVPNCLKEHAGGSNWVSWWAVTSHDQVRECHVVLVVLAVGGVAALPARWEHEFESDTISAVLVKIGLFRKVMAVKSAFRGLCVVETVESNCTLSQVFLLRLAKGGPLRLIRIWLAWVADCVAPPFIASRDHLESWGEGGDIVTVK